MVRLFQVSTDCEVVAAKLIRYRTAKEARALRELKCTCVLRSWEPVPLHCTCLMCFHRELIKKTEDNRNTIKGITLNAAVRAAICVHMSGMFISALLLLLKRDL